MIVTVSGSRHCVNSDKIFITLNLNKEYISFINVGDCKGVDKFVIQWCIENNINFKVFNANWDLHGRAAGPIRNKEMIDISDALIAFPMDGSIGTYSAIKIAQKQNKKILVVKI